jgi:hypothetical protein
VFFGKCDNTENAANPELGFIAIDRLAELTDVGAGLGGSKAKKGSSPLLAIDVRFTMK